MLGAALLTPGRGGIARVARMTARALSELGGSIVPISYLDSDRLEAGGVPVAVAAGSKLRFAALCMMRAAGCTDFLYDSAGIARAHPALFVRKTGYIVWMHGIEAWELLRPEHHEALRRSALVLVNSRYTLDRFQALHGELPQARVCWLATDDDDVPEDIRRPSGPRCVLALSRLDVEDAYKGHSDLMDAWPRVQAAVPDAKLLIAGDGSGRGSLEGRARQLGLDDAVEFTGYVPESDLPRLWARADVFALPSRKEGFGLVYVEAMRQGLPVVASVHDAGREVNIDGETGFNVDLGKTGMLAQCLIELLADENLRRRMGRAGRSRWRKHFCYSGFRARLQAILAAETRV